MLTYKAAGVDIDKGNALVDRIKQFATGIGGFAGAFPIHGDQLLVAATDGVGTKLQLAIDLQIFDSIGQDLVAMCVNDLVTVGARPLFFLDYYATGKLDLDQAESVIKGISKACNDVGAALLGGETAEMPGFYPEGKFDLAGFTVGMVHQDKYLTGEAIAPGDVLLALPSSGVHSNGFSMVRHILKTAELDLNSPFEETTLGQKLLTPTALYVKPVLDLLSTYTIKGFSHITGGGFENIERILKDDLKPVIDWPVNRWPSLFQFLMEKGNVAPSEMIRTFNVGVGMVAVCAPEVAQLILDNNGLTLETTWFKLGHIEKK
jgi:phosphoribosylformylglycinamidine cyclo-ligase